MRATTNIVFFSILTFHILWCLYAFYSMFNEYDGWTVYHWQPLVVLLYTIVWAGICFKNYWFGFAYIGLVMIAFLIKAAFKQNEWASVIGEALFPVDLIFVAVLLILFKTHFGILKRPDAISDSTGDNA